MKIVVTRTSTEYIELEIPAMNEIPEHDELDILDSGIKALALAVDAANWTTTESVLFVEYQGEEWVYS